jgi:hypothetical protein
LSSADLSFADLRSADLRSADLRFDDLRSADLRSANLRFADLSSADLSSANLRSADLRSADLRFADLRSADLSSADLGSADLRFADLGSADLRSAKNTELAIALTVIVAEGCLTVYKQAKVVNTDKRVLVTLEIPKSAKRSNAAGRKCRASAAVVKALKGIGFDLTTGDTVVSLTRNFFPLVYEKGTKLTTEKPFCEDRWQECASGIHFFLTREEAIAYNEL